MYPKCTKTRAVIHQRLFHDSSEFYVRILDIANLAFSSGANPVITIQHRDNIRKALLILEVITIIKIGFGFNTKYFCSQNFLEGHDYFAGNMITIADLSYLASMSTLIVCHIRSKIFVKWFNSFVLKHFGFNISPYKNVNNWYKRMKEIPGFKECDEGAREFAAIVRGKIANSFESIWTFS